jgi:dTDP-4-dehydrorhamnose reductase
MPRYSKVVILGASGIIGQYMAMTKPSPVEHLFLLRREGGGEWSQFDLETEPIEALGMYSPDVVVNLAGESRVDVVEADPDRYWKLNVEVPIQLAEWCDLVGAHYIHISTQAVFSGDHPPYHPEDITSPVNAYGHQKAEAEIGVARCFRWTIARPTFVLGARPIKTGRSNPLEDILDRAGQEQQQVKDRFFSVSFANDVAHQLWQLVAQQTKRATVHIGIPHRLSRYDVARAALKLYQPGAEDLVTGVSSESFPNIAPRPKDTTYSYVSLYSNTFQEELRMAVGNYIAFKGAR